MASELGAQLRLPGLKPNFPHPVNGDKKVLIYLDICHMLKLIRKALTDFDIVFVHLVTTSCGNI